MRIIMMAVYVCVFVCVWGGGRDKEKEIINVLKLNDLFNIARNI